jgi:hypothetical protein
MAELERENYRRVVSMAEQKAYVAAVKHGSDAPADWPERLARIEGVTVTQASTRQSRFTATPEAAKRVRAQLSSYCHIEELTERRIL